MWDLVTVKRQTTQSWSLISSSTTQKAVAVKQPRDRIKRGNSATENKAKSQRNKTLFSYSKAQINKRAPLLTL